MKKRFKILLLSFFLIYPSGLMGQDGEGGTRSIFTLGAGSRAIAMGGAFAAIGDDPSVLFYNPAALKLNPYPAVLVNHIQLFSGFSDATYDFIGLVYPTMTVGSFGVGFMTAGTGGIRQFDSYSVEYDEISYRESQAILSYAFDLPWEYAGKITVGSSVKILNQRIGDFSDTGTGMDLGILYRHDFLRGLIIGCNLQDIIGAETKLVAVTEKVDRTLAFGAGYSYLFKSGSSLTLSAQVDIPERADKDIRFGAEYGYKKIVFFRAGFDSESITAGVGFGWGRYEGDYGYFSREEAGSSHPFSVVARLGKSVEEKYRLEKERKRAEEEAYISEVFAARVSAHIDTARAHISDGKREMALDELKIALEYDPGNKDAESMLDALKQEILDIQSERTRNAEKSLLINQHFGLGLKYYSNNEYILARAEWLTLLELDPANIQAGEYLERTEEKLADQVRQHIDKALSYEKEGGLSDALNEWNIVRMIDPENEEALAGAERVNRLMEQIDIDYKAKSLRLETIDHFENALKAFSEGRYEEAADLLRRVIGQQPDHQEAKNLLMRINRKMTPLTSEQKEMIRQYYIEGMKHFTLGDFSASIEAWQKILEIDPDNESVQKNIEEAQQRLKKLGSSEED
ncbi:MAG: PorV/PorQ family protein [Candidatus Krumholzibacteriota bacterium]|nr:PorV/PorQ family protein [Candidatus Krumholzibacteriota bacterium]